MRYTCDYHSILSTILFFGKKLKIKSKKKINIVLISQEGYKNLKKKEKSLGSGPFFFPPVQKVFFSVEHTCIWQALGFSSRSLVLDDSFLLYASDKILGVLIPASLNRAYSHSVLTCAGASLRSNPSRDH